MTKALEIRRRVVAQSDIYARRDRLADSYLLFGVLAKERDDLPEAVANFEELVKQRQAILKERPESLRGKRYLADAEMALGEVLDNTGQHKRALKVYQDALKGFQPIMWTDPTGTYYRNQVCHSHYCVAAGHLKLGDKKLAQHHFQEALKIREQLYREEPANQTPGTTRRRSVPASRPA